MKIIFGLLVFFLAGTVVMAAGQVITINLVTAQGVGKEIGKVAITDTQYGVVLKPDLSDLPPGMHGFHLHENPSCEPAAKDNVMTAAHSAGAHFDPKKTGVHDGPYGHGHMGDLPALCVDPSGRATQPILAPRLKTDDFKGHALIIHEGGDNYSDQPTALGGGGARIACGAVK